MVTFQVATWENITDPKNWLSVSTQLAQLQHLLDADPKKEQPYNHEAAEALRRLFRDEAKLLKTLVDFEKTLESIRAEASEHKKQQAEKLAQAEARLYLHAEARLEARVQARVREREAEERKRLSGEKEKQEEEDRKLVEQFIVVDEREIDEDWEEIERPQEESNPTTDEAKPGNTV